MIKKQTEQSMLKAVHNYFSNDYKYCLKNSFVFRYDWESDYFCVNREGYSFEIEVKISKSDFKSDFKKEKHKLFVDKNYKSVLPNKFYYAIPKGLIKLEDLPSYAGLIVVDGSHAKIEKRAPFLHKKKFDFRKILCDKFYYNWLLQKKNIGTLQYQLETACNKIANLSINSFIYEKLSWEVLEVNFKTGKVVGKQHSYYDQKKNEFIRTNEVKEFNIKDVKFK